MPKQYTGRPEKYEELAHTPRDSSAISAAEGLQPAKQVVFRTRFDPTTGQVVEERFEEPVYCKTCHEMLWTKDPHPWSTGLPQNFVHKDGSWTMMLCQKCGYRAAPGGIPPMTCPQCATDPGWGDDHYAIPEAVFTEMTLKFPTRVADELEKLRALFGDEFITKFSPRS